MSSRESLLDELQWRGLLYQQTEGLAAHLAKGPVTAYCGFDPTAASLHVGNLVPVMGLVHLQRAGHRPIALVGGGTALIGDPSGKSTERPLIGADEVEANSAALRAQLGRFLDFSGGAGARMRDNAVWLREARAIDFMRDVGKHFTVNYMLAKESVQARLETGISYTEFSYMLLQAYDFLELHRREGATLQIGGSDQWGNITAGTELIRRSAGAEAHGLTLPLVTNASGKKFGKTEAGAVWLDATLTSPYQFFQFWVNTEDADIGTFFRLFTLESQEQIDAHVAAHSRAPHERKAQKWLAFKLTEWIHGRDAAARADSISQVIFDKTADPGKIKDDGFADLSKEIPSSRHPGAEALSVLDVLEQAFGLSRSAGRKLVQQGAVTVNGEKLAADALTVPREKAVRGRWFLVRKGARDIALADVG
ncbi:MAG: tyrosine--tRNA ligase [Gemmatimonadales bacterium]|jgi:tyrosyl-tRNA synthetase